MWIGSGVGTFLLIAASIGFTVVRRVIRERRFAEFREKLARGEIPASGPSPSPLSSTSVDLYQQAQQRSPVTAEEGETVARQFAERLKAPGGKNSAFGMIDYKMLAYKSLHHIEMTDLQRSQMANGLSLSLNTTSMTSQLPSDLSKCALLRMRTQDGKPTALIRLHLGNNLNYIELGFERNASNQAVIGDLYLYTTSEWMSESIHRRALTHATSLQASFLERLTSKESDFVKHAKALEKIKSTAQYAPAAALQEFNLLPESLRRDKGLMVMRLGMAGRVPGGNEFEAAYRDFQAAYPNDPALYLFGVDYYFLTGDLQRSIECLRQLDNLLDGDAAIHLMIAQVCIRTGDLGQARNAIDEALRLEPENAEAQTVNQQLSTVGS